MSMVMRDSDIIRAVRDLCIQHRFDEATELARKVADEHSRKTLLSICKSFENTQFRVKAA